MAEIKRAPFEWETPTGMFTVFDEEHTICDAIRWVQELGVYTKAELIAEIQAMDDSDFEDE